MATTYDALKTPIDGIVTDRSDEVRRRLHGPKLVRKAEGLDRLKRGIALLAAPPPRERPAVNWRFGHLVHLNLLNRIGRFITIPSAARCL
jgi:hypothetical protein